MECLAGTNLSFFVILICQMKFSQILWRRPRPKLGLGLGCSDKNSNIALRQYTVVMLIHFWHSNKFKVVFIF
jgi:hypothetical protein